MGLASVAQGLNRIASCQHRGFHSRDDPEPSAAITNAANMIAAHVQRLGRCGGRAEQRDDLLDERG